MHKIKGLESVQTLQGLFLKDEELFEKLFNVFDIHQDYN